MLWVRWSAIVRDLRLGADVKSHSVEKWLSQKPCEVLKAVAHIASRHSMLVEKLVRAPL